jgi:hypothetical protein
MFNDSKVEDDGDSSSSRMAVIMQIQHSLDEEKVN